jgi:hypothetical protein
MRAIAKWFWIVGYIVLGFMAIGMLILGVTSLSTDGGMLVVAGLLCGAVAWTLQRIGEERDWI